MTIHPVRDDEDEFEEPADACVRRELGLRPADHLETPTANRISTRRRGRAHVGLVGQSVREQIFDHD